MSLEALLEMWDKDSVVDKTDPSKEILRIPNVHAKYVRQLVAQNLALKKCEMEYARMKKLKWEYYQGKMDQDELKKYGWEPFGFILKNDITTYIDADTDLAKIQARKILFQQGIDACNLILKEINNRTWQVKEFMGWEKFIQGQH